MNTLLFMLISIIGNAQTSFNTLTLNTGGSFYESSDYKISSNIGEMSLVNTFFTPDFILSNGVLQPLISTKNIKPISPNFALKLYPTIVNTNNVFIESNNSKTGFYFIKVFTTLGQLQTTKTLPVDKENYKSLLNLENISAGNYFIEVTYKTDDGIAIINKTFRIQKF